MTVKLTHIKAARLKNACGKIQANSVTIRQFAELIGQMVAAEPGVSYAPPYYRTLELEKSKWLKIKCGVFDALIFLSKQSNLDIVW